MARPKKKRKAQNERLHREPIVRRVAELLDTGQPTKWRWTSEARHGLRAAMCRQGMAWAAADKRAEEIITLARHRIGLSLYPTWTEAQGETPREREYWFCCTCGGFMRSNGSPWCSEECRNVLRMRERTSAGRNDDAARESARPIILTGGAEKTTTWQKIERRCHQCSKSYTPTAKRQRYCSVSCSRVAARGPARECLICAEQFRPTQESKIYCGEKCAAEAERRRYQALREAEVQSRACPCGAEFKTSDRRKLYCRPLCKGHALSQRRKANRAQKDHTRTCRVCGGQFTSVYYALAAWCALPNMSDAGPAGRRSGRGNGSGRRWPRRRKQQRNVSRNQGLRESVSAIKLTLIFRRTSIRKGKAPPFGDASLSKSSSQRPRCTVG